MSLRRPQDLVFTLFGEYLARQDAPVWVGSLIALLRPFRVSEGAVRTVLSRMARKRWLSTRRVGRNAYYALTARGHQIVEEGEARIYHPPTGKAWDGRWYLLTYSIPEDVRHLRDRLRVRLPWLGFGPLGNGVWISPHDVARQVEKLSAQMGLGDNLVCFRAKQMTPTDHAELVRRCWNLPEIAARYDAFLATWRAEAGGFEAQLRAGTLQDDHAFVLRFRLIHEYREFPLIDPFLPDELLPDGWPGHAAADLFNRLHDLLVPPSDRYVAAVLACEPAFRKRLPPAST
jgi:phenylacetic acid degradation operon negative regulatory protein